MIEVLKGLLLICSYIVSSNFSGNTDYEYVVFLCKSLKETIQNIIERHRNEQERVAVDDI